MRSFEIPNTGLSLPSTYHIISDVKLDKRTTSVPVGPNSDDPLGGGSGYVGIIFMQVFASKEARDQGLKPIYQLNAAMPELDINFRFAYDPTIPDSLLTQAYNHLKTTEYYKDAQEV